MNQGRDDCLQPVGKNFGDYFHGAIEVGNGLKSKTQEELPTLGTRVMKEELML